MLENLPPSLSPQRATLARCPLADSAGLHLQAPARYSDAIWNVVPRPAFTFIPIAPAGRLSGRTTCASSPASSSGGDPI